MQKPSDSRRVAEVLDRELGLAGTLTGEPATINRNASPASTAQHAAQ